MSDRIEVRYDGKYPALCMGDLVIVVDGKEWKFPNNCLSSGGSAGVDSEYDEYCYYGDWSIDEYPKGFPEELKEAVIQAINKQILKGCCGRCI